MTIIAVPSTGDGGLNEKINPRFGRCPSFTLVTVEDNEIIAVKTLPNPGAREMGSAGIQAAQTLGENNANVLIAGLLGPNAVEILNSLDINIFHAPDQDITIKQIIEQFLQGKLKKIKEANIGAQKGIGAQ